MRLLTSFLLVAIALAQEPVDVADWMELGARESSYGNYRRVAVAFERAVAADPSRGRAQFLLGEAYGQQFRPNVDEPESLRLETTAGGVLRLASGALLASGPLPEIMRGIVDGTGCDAEALEGMVLSVYARELCPNGCNKDGAGEVVTVVPLDDAALVAQFARRADGARRKAPRRNRACGMLTRPEIDESLRKLKVIE